ncbi:PAS domain S-box protein [Glaciihabitans arcticus]|uniref:histidine kinase n=1 Tax=Glaciihabitans arcticus TaxID=2668039 RepID=A0A4Q9GXY2_9MICO|nr:PAS domain S-box protein [Glaciihabitans arcticus]TBN57140.1 PAS domain S-box protein [Glaciihabitans arcticus]
MTTSESLMSIVRAAGFEALVESSPDPIFVLDTDGTFVFANDALLKRLGCSWDELRGTDFRPTVAEPDDTRVADEFDRACGGQLTHFRAAGVRRDGSTFHADVTNYPIRHEGAVVAVIGMARDVDELERLERSGRMLEKRLSTALNGITDGVYFFDHDWNFTWVNPPGERIAQLSEKELLGNSVWDLFPEMNGSEFGIAYRKAVAERVTVTVRDRFVSLDAWLEATVYPVDDGLAVYVRDVTDEEITRRHILESEKRLVSQAALLDVARDAILVRGMDHSVQYWNRAAEEIYGWTAAEVLGKSIRGVLYTDTAAFDAATAHTIEHGHWSGELEQIRRSGATLVADCRWSLVRDASGAPESIFAVNSDITERKRDDAIRQRDQRMESLGTLSGGIAHDLNNILAPMLMSVQMLAREETDPDRTAILGIIEASVKRGAAMIRQVLSFARGVEGQKVSIDVLRIVDDVGSFAREVMPRNITVVTETPPELDAVTGDPTQLLQVLVNLATNARDAMLRGGILTIAAQNAVDPDTAAAHVVITVQDSGTGIDPDTLARIFEPFFTTKAVGDGTGLGLATSAAIVESHGGRLEVESVPGEGSVFRISLPSAGSAASEGVAGDSRAEPVELKRGAGQLVLVVDDEAAIRHLTRQTLEEFGYTSAVASSGEQALDFIRSRGGAVALVLTDVTMPVMDGPALVERLGEEFPRIPVVMSSGNAGIDITGSIPLGAFLSKPFTTVQLLTALATALEGNTDV